MGPTQARCPLPANDRTEELFALTHAGCTPRRKPVLSVAGAAAALVAASIALTVSAPITAAQDTGPYPDTPAGAFYTPAVEALNKNGVFAGTLCAEGFCPDQQLDRATMAVWTVRVLDGQDPPAVTSTRFGDVAATDFRAAFIERFATLGVTQGCGDGTNFCPDQPVSRAEMAVFLSRAFKLADGPDPNFGDVAADAWFASSVAKLAASGITAGCGDGTNFCPDQPTTRAEMAIFLARAQGLVAKPGASPGGPASSGSSDGADPSGFTAVSAGNNHACAIRVDKSLECWGHNLERQLNAPRGEFLAVSAGGFHTCALRVDNTLSCWGERGDGQTSRPRADFLSLSSGFRHTCAVSADEDSEGSKGSGGSVQCWGLDGNGQATPTAGSYLKVSAGFEHTCGLRTDGAVQCWGGNGHGQAGFEDPTGPMTCTPSGCRPGYARIWGPFIDVSAGTTHTCAVRDDGTLHCWGETRELQSFPPDGEFVAVSSGFKHSCALAVDSTVHCWGRDAFGETRAPVGEFAAVSAGSSFSCGLRPDGRVECWGNNNNGRSTPPAE